MERPQVGSQGPLQDLPRPVAQALVAALALVVLIAAPRAADPQPLVQQQQPQRPEDSWQVRQAAAAEAATDGPGAVSFVVLDGGGRVVASLNPDNRVPSASTIKALILAAYLRQPKVADRELRSAEKASMDRMITASSNTDASQLLAKVGWGAVRELVRDAGVTEGFTPDTKSWGLSLVTARSLATVFHELPALVPQRHRDFAVGLFSRVIPSQQWGMTTATPADWSWHVKAGWISSTVNQVGAFVRGSQEFTVAITIEGDPGLGAGPDGTVASSEAVRTLAAVTGALFSGGDLPAGTGAVCSATLPVSRGSAPPSWAAAAPCDPSLRAM